MKTAGILGGVGPETTSEVYLSIISAIKNSESVAYPPMVIYNLPLPFSIEDNVIIKGMGAEAAIPYLTTGAEILERSGADFGILPCNTLHTYMPEIRQAVAMPFLSILEETTVLLKNKGVKKIGILGSETTIKSDLYGSVLKEAGIEAVYAPAELQMIVNQVIINTLQGNKSATDERDLETVCQALAADDAEAVLLGCTDLQLVAKNMQCSVPIFDTTQILIDAAVREMTST